jgi:hypothetical protein
VMVVSEPAITEAQALEIRERYRTHARLARNDS